MAVPQVSGAAALLIEADPKLYPWDVKRILLKSTDDLGETGPDNVFGYGALNIENALDRLQSPEGLKNPTLGRLSLSKAEASVGDPVIIEAGASGDVEGLIAHILGPDKEMEIPMIDFDSNSVYTAWWDTSYWAPGEYTVEVELKGTFGETELSSASFLLKP
jgi:serine protease AprX